MATPAFNKWRVHAALLLRGRRTFASTSTDIDPFEISAKRAQYSKGMPSRAFHEPTVVDGIFRAEAIAAAPPKFSMISGTVFMAIFYARRAEPVNAKSALWEKFISEKNPLYTL